MARYLGHYVHERQGIVVFVDLKRRRFTAQNFGEYISVIVGHETILSLNIARSECA